MATRCPRRRLPQGRCAGQRQAVWDPGADDSLHEVPHDGPQSHGENMSKVWTLFQNLLQVNPITYNKWDINTIELETAQLLELLTSALKKSTYFTTIKSPWRNNKWWSESLFRLKTKVIKLAKKLHSQDSTDEDRNSRHPVPFTASWR